MIYDKKAEARPLIPLILRLIKHDGGSAARCPQCREVYYRPAYYKAAVCAECSGTMEKYRQQKRQADQRYKIKRRQAVAA
jgi:hypothetical protein